MRPHSAKAKGRRFQQWVRDRLLGAAAQLEEDDIRSTSMGASGEDLLFSPAARKIYPIAPECKNQERLGIWEAMAQAEANADGFQPVLFFTRNRAPRYACLDADALIALYNDKFAKPGAELYTLAKPLRAVQAPFANAVDWSWWELWHHEGRRCRHGVSMFAPDYTHWHGTYEVAKTFYMDYVPELRELIEKNLHSDNAEKAEGAKALKVKLDEVLNRPSHRWYLGKLDPEEAARRKKAADEFKARYK